MVLGSFSRYILENCPEAEVVGLTLSKTQADFIKEKQKDKNHALSSDRFQLIHDDYNSVEFEQRFDRIVSVGVMEHISNFPLALKKMRSNLVQGGYSFHHFIAFNPDRPGQLAPRQNKIVDRYIFPGGRTRAYPDLVENCAPFKIEDHWFMSGNNYRRTIEAWIERFHENYKEIVASTGLDRATLKL